MNALNNSTNAPALSNQQKCISILSTEIRELDGLYCLNDLHKASGGDHCKRPGKWTPLDQTSELIQELKKQVPNMGHGPIKALHGGKNPGTFACKELVYSYAMWISAKFHLHVIRAFDQMVNEGGNAQGLLKPGKYTLQVLDDGTISAAAWPEGMFIASWETLPGKIKESCYSFDSSVYTEIIATLCKRLVYCVEEKNKKAH